MKRPRNPATGARSELTFTQAYRAGCRRGESRKLRQHWEPHTRSAEQTMSVRKLSPHTPVGTPSLTCMLGTLLATRNPLILNSQFVTIPKRPHNKCLSSHKCHLRLSLHALTFESARAWARELPAGPRDTCQGRRRVRWLLPRPRPCL